MGDARAGKEDEDALWLFRSFMAEAQKLVAHTVVSAENIQQAKAGAESAIRGFGEVGWNVVVEWRLARRRQRQKRGSRRLPGCASSHLDGL